MRSDLGNPLQVRSKKRTGRLPHRGRGGGGVGMRLFRVETPHYRLRVLRFGTQRGHLRFLTRSPVVFVGTVGMRIFC